MLLSRAEAQMTTATQNPLTFAYSAQTRDGQSITGTIDAADLAEANRRLVSLQLSTVRLEPMAAPPPPRPLRGDDFFAFNQQLAQLTSAGLPLEQGIRLLAAELPHGSMKRTLDLVAADLESGKSLPQAIEAHRAQFPPLYANLVEAGIRGGNLPRILLNLGRHLALVRRLEAMLWRTFSYPILVLVAGTALLCFMLMRIFPQLRDTFKTFGVFGADIAPITQLAMDASDFITHGGVWIVLGVLVVLVLAIWVLLWMTGRDRAMAERIILPLPLIGGVFRRNLISRWCDAVGLGVESGMDLPGAIDMAGDAIGSPGLRDDGRAMINAISAGRRITDAPTGRVLPKLVLAGIDLAVSRNDLPQGLGSLSRLYEEQAELHLGFVQAILTPIMTITMGIMVALLMLAMVAPLIALIEAITSPHF
jgi:type IV pilus assembly protein PilC